MKRYYIDVTEVTEYQVTPLSPPAILVDENVVWTLHQWRTVPLLRELPEDRRPGEPWVPVYHPAIVAVWMAEEETEVERAQRLARGLYTPEEALQAAAESSERDLAERQQLERRVAELERSYRTLLEVLVSSGSGSGSYGSSTRAVLTTACSGCGQHPLFCTCPKEGG